MEPSTPLPVGNVLRISKDRDGTGLGVERQDRDNRALAGRLGWTVVDTYADNDVSAYRPGRTRPETERAMRDLRSGRIRGLVAWHPDRVLGHPRELEDLIDLVEETGAQVATVQAGSYDLSTPSGRAMARQLCVMSRYEREIKAERHRAKHLQLAREGRDAGGGTRPYGYGDDRATIVAAEAAVVAEVARRIVMGESLRGLCADLDSRGIPTVTGRPWRQTTLRRMMLSGRVAGVRTHKGAEVGPAMWPGIIDRDLWLQVRRVLSDPTRLARSPARSYLLTGGIAVCGLCGARLVARPRQDKRRCYVCARGVGFEGCGKIRTLAEPFEALVRDAVLVALSGPRLSQARRRLTAPADGDATAELAEVEQRMDQLAEDWADGHITRREWARARKRLEARRAAVAAKVAAAGPSALDGLADVAAEWPGLGHDRRRAIVATVVDRVVVGPAARGRNTFDPGRVRIEWLA